MKINKVIIIIIITIIIILISLGTYNTITQTLKPCKIKCQTKESKIYNYDNDKQCRCIDENNIIKVYNLTL
jgi:hypothetical protein